MENEDDGIDLDAVCDQATVTSTVVVDRRITTRRYSDGASQINCWETEEYAQAYAASVREQEGS